MNIDDVSRQIEDFPRNIKYCRDLVHTSSDANSSELGRQIALFCSGLTLRFCILSEDVVFSFRNERVLAVSMCARGAVETVGILAEFRRKFQNALDPLDEDAIVSVAKNFLFASKEFGASREIATPHVLNGVRALDRDCPGIFTAYEILCETVHPNWAGRLNIDAVPDDIDRIAAMRIYLSTSYIASLFDVVVSSHSICIGLAENHSGVLARLMRRRKPR